MPKPAAQVTAAEISRLAGVTRATVSNWRRRHDDFPAPVGGTDSSPLYDLEAVRGWLEERGHSSAASSIEELRTTLRVHSEGSGIASRLMPFVLVTARLATSDIAELDELNDTGLVARAGEAVAALYGADGARYDPNEAAALRAVLRCMKEEGAHTALDVLAERELEDSASTGTYHTPKPLADLMAGFLAPRTGPYPERVLDPACGGGSLLAAAARHGTTSLIGQDHLPVQAQRSEIRLLLDAPNAEVTIRAGDSLRAGAFAGAAVDGVLCNPPYGDRDWGHDELAYDPRWAYGVPPRAVPELAWVQHALSHLAEGALAVMLLPPAVASRSSGRRVRAELLRGGALRAVVALPSGAAAPFHIGLHLWVLQCPEQGAEGSDTVLFIDSSGASTADTFATPEPGTSQPKAASDQRGVPNWDELNATILAPWRAFRDDPEAFIPRSGTARAVPLLELLDEFVDLTPARYVHNTVPADTPARTGQHVAKLTERLADNIEALAAATTAGGGWPAAGEEAHSWRTATVADLARGGALTLHRAVRGPQDGAVSAEHAGRAVLTGRDLAKGGRASGSAAEHRTAAPIVIGMGDLLISGLLGPRGAVFKVADEEDVGCLLGPNVHLLRPDATRLDSWFLAGFLAATDNVTRASIGTSAIHLDARRLRVPLLPLDEQRRYGRAFRQLHGLRDAARKVEETADETAKAVAAGLTAGALLPPDGDYP